MLYSMSSKSLGREGDSLHIGLVGRGNFPITCFRVHWSRAVCTVIFFVFRYRCRCFCVSIELNILSIVFFSGHDEVLVSKVEDYFSKAREMCHSLVS